MVYTNLHKDMHPSVHILHPEYMINYACLHNGVIMKEVKECEIKNKIQISVGIVHRDYPGAAGFLLLR